MLKLSIACAMYAPSGICHFLSSCPSYATQRATLATGVNEILHKVGLNHLVNQSQLYLYGDPYINNTENKKNYFVNNKIYKGNSTFLN